MPFLEIHIIQSLPPSNPNRGKDGDVKTTVLGGVLRSRISSQAQKRAARQWYTANAGLDRKQLADRSRQWHIELANELKWAPKHQRDSIARIILSLFNSGTDKLFQSAIEMKNLIFLGHHEIHKIAIVSEHCSDILCDLADRFEAYKIWDADQKKKDKKSADEPMVEVDEGATKPKKKEKAIFDSLPTKSEVKGLEKLITAELNHSVPGEVALFGRMMATLVETSVDGSVQVAHALSVNTCPRSKGEEWHAGEIDFFAAVDDKTKSERDSGAGMIGETSFTAPVHYRYASIATHEVESLMGDKNASRLAIAAFIEGFVRALPDGHSTAFAHATLPEFVLIQIKETAPFGLSGAFLTPIDRPDKSFPTDGGGVSISQSAVDALMSRRSEMIEIYDDVINVEAIVGLKDHHPEAQSLKSAITQVMGAL